MVYLGEHDLGPCLKALSCQRIKLVGERHCGGAIDQELAIANHMHDLDANEHIGGSAKRREAWD